MAIYFNDRILEPKENGTKLERRYFKELQEVKEVFDRFRKAGQKESVLVFTRPFKKVWNSTKTSYKPIAPIGIPMNVHVYDEELGSVEIRYSRRPPIRSGNRLIWQSDGESIIHEHLSISEQRLDFAWFLLKASPYIQTGVIKLLDKDAEYSGEFDDVKKQLEASRYIFDEDITEDVILAIAKIILPKSMKIEGETKKEVGTKLWNIVTKAYENRQPYGYDELIAAGKKILIADAQAFAADSKKDFVSIDLVDGRQMNVPFITCPVRTKEETLDARAEEQGIPREGLTRDELYSVIRYMEDRDKDE